MAHSSRHQVGSGRPLRVLGQYSIQNPIGQGAAATIYRAQGSRGEPVALKVLSPAAVANPEMRNAFLNEYRVLSRLRHPGILRAFDGGEASGYFYIALELVDGDSLEKVLERAKVLGEVMTVKIAIQLANALAYLHTAGFVHRDVKPSNILMGPMGRAILFDFGMVYRIGDTPDPQRAIYGTPSFLAPEQILARADLDGRADLYSLGVVLYRMVSGRKPFYGSREEVLDAHIKKDPEPPSQFRWASPALEAVILRLLAKDPDERFPSAKALSNHLGELHLEEEKPRSDLPQRLFTWLRRTDRPE